MAVVSVPGYEPWKVGRRVLRELLRRLSAVVELEEDRDAIELALAVDGLLLRKKAAPQGPRLARLLAVVVDEWRAEIGDDDPPDMLGIGEHLDELGSSLHDYDDGHWPAPTGPAVDYPTLVRLFKGYLYVDWPDEYGDPWAAVADFVAKEPLAANAGAEIDRLLAAGHDEHTLTQILLRDLGCGYAAVSDGWPSFRVWLAELARRVHALLAADDGT